MGSLGRAVAVAASSSAPAALSGSPLAWPGLGCGLRWAVRAACCTLWVSLPDPRAAKRHVNDDTDRRGQAAGHFLRVGSSPGWSDGVAVLDLWGQYQLRRSAGRSISSTERLSALFLPFFFFLRYSSSSAGVLDVDQARKSSTIRDFEESLFCTPTKASPSCAGVVSLSSLSAG